jgi:pentatricopeptide repeat protein
MHVHISSYGLDSHLALRNYILSLYVECGHVSDAEQIFRSSVDHNEYSWTSLIQGYVEDSKIKEAFEMFGAMKEEGFSPSTYTFVSLLKACGKMDWVERGKELHQEIAQEECDQDLFVGNSLVHMYFNFGMLEEARDVLNCLPERDIVSWTALITGYVEQAQCSEALLCLKQMELEGMSPDPVTYVSCLKACGILGDVEKGLEIHKRIILMGFEENLILNNTLIDMYGKCGLLTDAKKVFDTVKYKDIITWNALAAGYAEHGFGEEVLDLLKMMALEKVHPDGITFMCGLKACSSMGDSKRGQELYAEVVKEGFENDPFIGSVLIDFYAKLGALAEAREMFDEMPVRDVVTWTALTTGYASQGLDEEVLACFCQMQQERLPLDSILINTVMFSYADQGEIEKTRKLYFLMQEQGSLLNTSAFVGILVACGNSEALEIGKRVHAQSHNMGLSEQILATAILDMYCKCGSMSYAHQFFNLLPTRSSPIWNTLLTGYAHHGMADVVFQLVDQMNAEGVMLDNVTFLTIISVCNHLGLVDKGLEYFEGMQKHNVFPVMKHYSCVVDLLCRVGRLEEAVSMVGKMPIQPNLAVLHILLSACHKWGNVEIGKHVFNHARRLDEKHGAVYILMSNIYADSNIWECMLD